MKNNLKLLLPSFVFRYHSAKVGFLKSCLTNSVCIEFKKNAIAFNVFTLFKLINI